LAAASPRCRGDQAAVAAQIEQLAADLYVGLSRHGDVVTRALHAVSAVDHRIREMQANGGMADVNRFKAVPCGSDSTSPKFRRPLCAP
jgi:hypothetical protein